MFDFTVLNTYNDTVVYDTAWTIVAHCKALLGLIVEECTGEYSHHNALKSISQSLIYNYSSPSIKHFTLFAITSRSIIFITAKEEHQNASCGFLCVTMNYCISSKCINVFVKVQMTAWLQINTP